MPQNDYDCPKYQSLDKTADNKQPAEKTSMMAPQERRQQVLTVLEQSGVAMKSVDVFRNCKLRGATFEHRTTKNYLSQLIESGDVQKVDSQSLNDGEIVVVETGERGHFIATAVADTYRG